MPFPELLIRGKLHTVDRILVMGVVNASPESFSDSGRYPSGASRIELANRLVEEGADIIDVGGQSAITERPELDPRDELERVLPVVEWLASTHPSVLVSVDTYKPMVARAVLDAGAAIINDVSGLRDPALADACRVYGGALVVMHTRGRPQQRLQDPRLYVDVSQDVVRLLTDRSAVAIERGLDPRSLILDPGPDFTKTPHQTIAALRQIDDVRAMGRPVLLALSRKDFLGAITGKSPRGRDPATHAAIAFFAGDPGIVRVHDVGAARDVIATMDVLSGRRDIDEGYLLPEAIRHEPFTVADTDPVREFD